MDLQQMEHNQKFAYEEAFSAKRKIYSLLFAKGMFHAQTSMVIFI